MHYFLFFKPMRQLLAGKPMKHLPHRRRHFCDRIGNWDLTGMAQGEQKNIIFDEIFFDVLCSKTTGSCV